MQIFDSLYTRHAIAMLWEFKGVPLPWKRVHLPVDGYIGDVAAAKCTRNANEKKKPTATKAGRELKPHQKGPGVGFGYA